jgi:hypothetical protein
MNKTETAQHTPTPWTVEFGQVIVSEDTTLAMTAPVHNGPRVISDDECKANARHIVHCVNLHDELVQALEDLLAGDLTPGGLGGAYITVSGDTVRRVKATIARAKKENPC